MPACELRKCFCAYVPAQVHLPEVTGASRAYLQCMYIHKVIMSRDSCLLSIPSATAFRVIVYESPNSPGHETRVGRECGLLFFSCCIPPFSTTLRIRKGRRKPVIPPSGCDTISHPSQFLLHTILHSDLQYYARLVIQGYGYLC